MAAPKVVPPVLLWRPVVSEVGGGMMAGEVEPTPTSPTNHVPTQTIVKVGRHLQDPQTQPRPIPTKHLPKCHISTVLEDPLKEWGSQPPPPPVPTATLAKKKWFLIWLNSKGKGVSFQRSQFEKPLIIWQNHDAKSDADRGTFHKDQKEALKKRISSPQVELL